MDPAQNVNVVVHCNFCLRKTNHRVRAEHEYCEVDGDQLLYRENYQIVECCGCDGLSFRICFQGDEVALFPPAVRRREPEWRYQLPQEICSLLLEVFKACGADARALATMGIRAIIDAV